MTNYLITGSTGFIGRHLCRHLQLRNFRIKTVSRSGLPAAGVQQHWQGDLLRDNPPAEFFAGTDVVVHLAGLAHQPATGKIDAAAYFKLNRDATVALAAAADAAGVNRFIFISSVKAARYEPSCEPNDETNRGWPEDPYGLSKRQAEEDLLGMALARMQVTIVRPSLVYGVGVKGNLSLMLRAQKSGWLPLISGGGARSMVSVDDLCEALIAVSRADCSGNPTFIVADGQHYNIERIGKAMRTAMGQQARTLRVSCSVLSRFAAVTESMQRRVGVALPLNRNMVDKLCGSELYSAALLQSVVNWHPGQMLEDLLPAMLNFDQSP